MRSVTEDEQLMVITRNGVVNRQAVHEIRVIGRATQGVKLVNLDEGDAVMDVARVIAEDEDETNGEAEEAIGAEAVEQDDMEAATGEPEADEKV